MRNTSAMMLERAVHHILLTTPMPDRERLLRYLDDDDNPLWQGIRPQYPWAPRETAAVYDPLLRAPPVVVPANRGGLPETLEFRPIPAPNHELQAARQRLMDQTDAAMGMLAAGGGLLAARTANEVTQQMIRQHVVTVNQARAAQADYQRWTEQERHRADVDDFGERTQPTRTRRFDDMRVDIPEDLRTAQPATTGTPQQPTADGAW